MGVVYRARDPRLGREVAVKLLPSDLARDENRLKRFELEARAAAALNHPNVVTAHDVGTEEGTPYVVMELLNGETLRQGLAGEVLPVGRVVHYAAQVARGLAAVHDKDILHRDLKPEKFSLSRCPSPALDNPSAARNTALTCRLPIRTSCRYHNYS